MSKSKGKTIAVIGAGVIGITLARRLQREGHAVLLFDPHEPGMGASYGNAGYIACDEILPLSHGISYAAVAKMMLNPLAPLAIRWQQIFSLIPWFLKFLIASRPAALVKSAEALAALQKDALKAWEKAIREEGLTSLTRKNGAMIVFETEKSFNQESLKFPFLDQHRVRYQILSGDQAREMIPELSRAVTRAIFYPNGFHVRDPLAVSKRIFDNVIKAGGAFIGEAVTGFEREAGAIKAVLTEKGRHPADAAVIAAGHQSINLMKSLGVKVPLVAERGYHVVMDHAPLSFDMCFGSHERGFFITPMDSGLRLAGTVEFSPAGKILKANWKRADILKTHVAELLPGIATKEKDRWMGHRPTFPDFLPTLGRAPGVEGLYLSFGHQHLGLTLAPVSAEILASLITSGESPLDLTPFDALRFG